MNDTTTHRTPAAIVARLIVLVKPMLPIMLAAIVMGVAGHFCATFITIFGGFAILTAAGLQSPLPTVGTAFGCILVFALLRGVLRYAEQASNHYIAFRLLALIRDKVFGALRRLTPAKLEGRDRGDLISLITADIEALEVFYAHTISPVCIAVLWAAGMTAFTAHWHILPALALLAGYLMVGVVLPVWSAKRGQAVAREYRQALADTNSYVLESLRSLRDTLQYQDTAALRAQESLVTQETELFADTIGNNIRIAKRDATQEEVEAACKKAALDDFIRSLPKGYDTPVGELGGALSDGERQRIGVARAFLHDAPFLLLDEPTSNLDSLNEGIILRAIRAACKERTVLLVSHRKSTMAAADVSFSVESRRVS